MLVVNVSAAAADYDETAHVLSTPPRPRRSAPPRESSCATPAREDGSKRRGGQEAQDIAGGRAFVASDARHPPPLPPKRARKLEGGASDLTSSFRIGARRERHFAGGRGARARETARSRRRIALRVPEDEDGTSANPRAEPSRDDGGGFDVDTDGEAEEGGGRGRGRGRGLNDEEDCSNAGRSSARLRRCGSTSPS